MGEMKTYAFGDSKLTGIPCPVKATGRNVTGHELTVAEKYDQVVRDWYGIDEGVLPESVARSAWSEAVSRIKVSAMNEKDHEHADWLHQSVEVGENIKAEVF